MSPITLLIVDDHQLFRDGIISLLADWEQISIVGVAESVEDSLRKIETLKPEVVLLDVSLFDGSGIQIAKKIKECNNHSKIIILSMHAEEETVLQALTAGVQGYLLKQNTNPEELRKAIIIVSNGGEYYNETLLPVLQQFIQSRNTQSASSVKINSITRREKEVLNLVVQGLSNAEIADLLSVNIRTIETHKSNLLKKLELKNTVELVKFALKNELVEVQ